MRPTIRLFMAVIIGTVMAILPNEAFAQFDKTWTGAISTDWNDGGNWDPVGVPGAGDNVGIIDVTNDPALSGDVTVNNLTLQFRSQLTFNQHMITVNGNLHANNDDMGGLIMTNSADVLEVFGQATFQGIGTLTAGFMTLHGPVVQTPSSIHQTLTPDGTHITLAGAGTQTVSFASPGTSFFDDLAITNTAGVTFSTDVHMNGQLTLGSGAVLNQASNLITYYRNFMPSIAGGTYNVVNTYVDGALTLTEDLTLPASDNHISILFRESITFNQHTLSIGGNLHVNSDDVGGLIMTNSADVLEVFGQATFQGIGTLTAGFMTLHGPVVQTPSSVHNTLTPDGTHITLAGAGTQTVSFASPGTSFFDDLTITNTAGVTFSTDVHMNGHLILDPGAIVNQASNLITYYRNVMPSIAGGTYNVVNTYVDGALTLTEDLTLPASDNHISILFRESITFNQHTLSIGGNLHVNSDDMGGLIMTNSADVLEVFGQATFQGIGTLTAGFMTLHGPVVQTPSSVHNTLTPDGTHITLAGAGTQTVSFASPGTSFFDDLTITNTAGVTFSTDVHMNGHLILDPGAIVNQASNLITYYRNVMPSIAGGTYNVVNTYVDGALTLTEDLTLPASDNHISILFRESITFNQHTLSIGGNLHVNSDDVGGLIMTNSADVLEVFGQATFQGIGTLTAGFMRLHGDVSQVPSSVHNTLTPDGTHITLAGTGTQNISFASPGTSFFDDLNIANTSLSSVVLNSTVIVNGQLQSPGDVTSIIAGNGNVLTVNGGLDVDELILDDVTFTVNGGQIDKFNHVTFQNYSIFDTQMTLNHTDLNANFVGVEFLVDPQDLEGPSGYYIEANDTDGGAPAILNMINADPADGSFFTDISGGFQINWVTELYAVDDEVTTPEDNSILIHVLDNDMNPLEGTLLITGGTNGTNGSININSQTTITYHPDPDFHGTDTFMYDVTDGQTTDTGKVTVIVTPDQGPVISAHPSPMDFGSVPVGSQLSQMLYVKNSGVDDLEVSDIEDPFFVFTDTMFTVSPGDSHAVEITFVPGFTGIVLDTLHIFSNDELTPVLLVPLSGTGIPVGDLTGDDIVNILDIISLVNIVLGSQPAPDPESTLFLRADINGDGNLNILDIVGLINIILEIPQKPIVTDITNPARMEMGAVQIRENQEQRLPIELQYAGSLAGLQLTLTYDPKLVRIGTPEPADRLGEMKVDVFDADGKLRMLVYSTDGRTVAPGAGPLVYVPVEIRDETSDTGLHLDGVILAGAHGLEVPVHIPVGQQRLTALPSEFELKPSAPNPFNPSTTIAYEVPKQAHVRIIVYNLLGQEVIRLVDEPRTPGRYTVVWNGRNARGHGVASGLYMYRMTTDTGFTKAQRMLLLK